MLIELKKSREDYFEGRANCSDFATSQKEWKKLWSMKLQSKIKVFCWRLALNSIPTASVLKSRNLASTSHCKICGAVDDTWEHSLLFCTMSKCVWALLDEDITNLISHLRISNPKQWITFMCCNIPQADGIRVLVTCWAIWQARRKAIHEGVFQSPFSIMVTINRQIEELQMIRGMELKGGNQNQSKQKTRLWKAPDQGKCKINVDAAVNRVGSKGAVGVVCRNDRGEFIAASAMIIPNITEPETLEGMACLEALALAEDCGIRKIIVASDCLNIVRNISEMPLCTYVMILKDIQERAKSFDYVRFAHEGRECNREADRLVKYACSLEDGRHVWLGSPPVFLNVNISIE
jgi:ribonuclease HI